MTTSVELAEVPAAVLDYFTENRGVNGAAPVVHDVIPTGQRDTTLTSLAGTMRRRGMSESSIAAALREENRKCDPPLDESDIRRIAKSIARREPAERIGEAARAPRDYRFASMSNFVKHPFPRAEPLLGGPGAVYLAVGTLLVVYGSDGSGKSTWTADGIAHCAAGRDWLGIPVPRPVRFLVIENEGPPSLFQEKLAAKAATWEGPAWENNVHVFQSPWGEFTFADRDARQALSDYCDEHEIEFVTANPTLGLGVAGSGRPEETQLFVDWLVECGLKGSRSFWLLHHENKAGQISGDWGRHPDTKVQLQQDGNRPRTKLVWEKTRWATLPANGQSKAVMLEWVIESQGYSVVELDTVGASDDELQARLDAFLTEHPWSSTKTVETEVKGTASRIRKLLDSERYDVAKGPRGANLWNLSTDLVEGSDDEVTR